MDTELVYCKPSGAAVCIISKSLSYLVLEMRFEKDLKTFYLLPTRS